MLPAGVLSSYHQIKHVFMNTDVCEALEMAGPSPTYATWARSLSSKPYSQNSQVHHYTLVE